MADQNLGTFSPEDMIAIISGVGIDGTPYTHALSGWADGSFISVERMIPSSTLVQGATSNGSGRVFRTTKNANISFTILQFSSDNDVLSAIWKQDYDSRDNSALFNMILKDGSGRSVFHCSQCYLENIPAISYGVEGESRTWVVQCMNLDQYVGGNAKIPSDIVLTLQKLGVTVDEQWLQN